jgi:hypothetical protein
MKTCSLYPPTLEEINHALLSPYLYNVLDIIWKNDNGKTEKSRAKIAHWESNDGYSIEWRGLDKVWREIDLDLSVPFDQESIESKSIIVFDIEKIGVPFLLIRSF